MTELEKAYSPSEIEEKWYTYWKESGFFAADPSSNKPPFCVMIPPPNVTGVLHMGHALVDTLIDSIARFKRMQGYDVLWQPGTDHAGISTQTVVERHLMKTEGKRRKEYTREEFLRHVFAWKDKSERQILFQLQKLGCSADWDRCAFTMDEKRSHAVSHMFKKMFDDGLIYRGNYLVNWDPVTQTALADDEVEYEEKASHLWHFVYDVEDGSKITIATTRPETMLGDTAIAVSANDERYAHLIGKNATLPLIHRTIPIVADRYVDPSFGTGAVKITPAHDPNDYEIALRHDLPMITIMTDDGKINENGGSFQGLTMAEARKAVVEAMKNEGRLAKTEPHTLRVGISYRSKAVIEPHLSKQWFVKISAFKDKLLDAVESGRVELIPPHWKTTYEHWITNLRDWCISRQLWWGHRIPIWYNIEDPQRYICYAGEGIPPEIAHEAEKWKQDDDVLDTWFSSALWPFSTLGWPEKTPELSRYYPNATLITGHDILFFWVARMIFMGEYAMGDVPFTKTFLHGLIYGKSYWRELPEGGIQYVSPEEKKVFDLGEKLPSDVHSKWEKMSKSKGNVIDPLEIIDTYGTDAMRMALTSSVTYARQIDLDRRRFEEFKNFANKLWNGARFVFMNLSITVEELSQGLDSTQFTLDDKWILSRLSATITDVTEAIEAYSFDSAATKSYEFFWNDFCAQYVESCKPYLFGKTGTPEQALNKKRILTLLLSSSLRLMHPMAPFITEELFQKLKTHFGSISCTSSEPYMRELLASLNAKACIAAPFPTNVTPSARSPEIEAEFAHLSDFVRAIRNLRAEMGIAPSMKSSVYASGSEEMLSLLQNNLATLFALIPLETVSIEESCPSQFSATAHEHGIQLTIPLPESLLEKEKLRLQKVREKTEASLAGLISRLENPEFIQRAPEALVAKTMGDKARLEEELSLISQKLASL